MPAFCRERSSRRELADDSVSSTKGAAMRKLWVAGLCALCLGTIGSAVAVADDDTIVLRAKLSGFNEVPPISGTGAATFKATVHSDGSIDFTLVYENLTGNPSAAHIHFAQKNVNGNVVVFF